MVKRSIFRRRRREGDDIEHIRTLELEGYATAMGAVLIVGVGFAMAHMCVFLLQPACIYQQDNSTLNPPTATMDTAPFNATPPEPGVTPAAVPKTAAAAGVAITKSAHTSDSHATTTANTKTESMPGFPPTCTDEQFAVLHKQLPPEGCEENAKKPWKTKMCSFAKETHCGNGNPHWFYDFIHFPQSLSSDDDPTFRGIIVGCNKGYEAVEMLRIASPPNEKYNLSQWKEEFLKMGSSEGEIDTHFDTSIDCKADGMATSNRSGRIQNAEVYCLEATPKTFAKLVETRDALGYSDDELHLSNLVVGANFDEDDMDLGKLVTTEERIGSMGVGLHHWAQTCERHKHKNVNKNCVRVPTTTIDGWIEKHPKLSSTLSTTKRTPLINILSITAETSDYEILMGSAKSLKNIQYIDFNYHWYANWADHSFNDLIMRLKKKGFACYFTSTNENMWRITDCWQDHYEIKYQAAVGCVNVNLPAAKPLLAKMEEMFLSTLQDTE